VRVERNDLPFTAGCRVGQVLRLPIAHGEGNYTDRDDALDRLEERRGVVLRYVGPGGEEDASWNLNGSARAIAGVCNERGNVFGLMPHPERCAEAVLGNEDGLTLFASAVRHAQALGGRA
jgi:phosphoribosylformylglycinamidine synthase